MLKCSLRGVRFQSLLIFICAVLWSGRESAEGEVAFSDYVTYPTDSRPEAVAIADLNGDGRKDVIMTTSGNGWPNENSLLVFFQNVSGGLDAPVQYDAGGLAVSLALADFDGDATTEIAVGLSGRGIRLFRNVQGNLIQYDDFIMGDAGQVCAGDFNHDGLADLAATADGGCRVNLFAQARTGSLELTDQYLAFYSGSGNLKAADVNGDGWTDIVIGSPNGYAVPDISVLLQTEKGFAPVIPYMIGWGMDARPAGISIGDVNGDGRNEIVAPHGNGPGVNIAVFTQTPQGSLRLHTNYNSYTSPTPAVIADFDMDGRQDIAIIHSGWLQAGVHLQTVSGTLAPEQLFPVPYITASNPQGLAVGDINGDGRPDIVVADQSNLALGVLYNASTPPALRISRIERRPNGQVVLTVPYCGPHGACVVERADTPGNWKDAGWLTDYTWVDDEPTAVGTRFYRLRAP